MADEDQTTSEEIAEASNAPDLPADLPSLAEQLEAILTRLDQLMVRFMQPWSAYQAGIIVALLVIALLIHRYARPGIRSLMLRYKGAPPWVLRIEALILQRLWLVAFVVLSWGTVLLMREVTWPSHSYFISIAAMLASAWCGIWLVSRLIPNRSLRRVVSWVAWIWASVEILGLTEILRNVLDALAIETGTMRVSVYSLLVAVLTLAVLIGLAGFLSRVSASRIHRIRDDDMSPSIRVLLIKVIQLALFGIAFLMGLRIIGFDLTNLALLSGAIGLGIGFGLQKIVSNLVSGVIILLDKSIKPGDVISLGDTFGWITQLGARYASVLTRDGREYLIPNEDFITSQVINWSHSSDLVRLDIHFGVAYSSDPHLVKRVASEAPLRLSRVVKDPKPVCHIVNLGDSSIDFVLRFWIRDSNKGLTNIRGDVYLALWDVLKENEIDIPFPQREVRVLQGQDLPMD